MIFQTRLGWIPPIEVGWATVPTLGILFMLHPLAPLSLQLDKFDHLKGVARSLITIIVTIWCCRTIYKRRRTYKLLLLHITYYKRIFILTGHKINKFDSIIVQFFDYY